MITISGEPSPKERPRFNSKTGRTYTPKNTRSYEDMVAMIVRSKRLNLGIEPVKFTAVFYTAKKKPGDTDNFFKAVSDGAATGGAFDNDRQIQEIHAYRIRSTNPRVEFTIEAVEELVEG